MQTGLEWLDGEIAGCADVNVERLSVGKRQAALVSATGMIDNAIYKDRLLPALGEWLEGKNLTEGFPGAFALAASNDEERARVLARLFSGSVLIVNDGRVLAYPIPRQPERSPEESSSEISVKGPRDGFVESLPINRTLVRKRLKSSDLKIESFCVGTDSQTEINLLYLKSAASRSLVEEARKRIGKLSPDIVVGSGQVEEMLSDRSRALFPSSTIPAGRIISSSAWDSAGSPSSSTVSRSCIRRRPTCSSCSSLRRTSTTRIIS